MAELSPYTPTLTFINPADIELHADLEHEIWSSWMQYMFSKGIANSDGSWTMPAWAVERWKRQAATPYSELPETQHASDVEQVQKHIDLSITGIIDRSKGTGLK